MGLTGESAGGALRHCGFSVRKETEHDKIVALAGNPNVGKSTLFNRLTGLNQHTGNWPGKTVTSALGKCRYGNQRLIVVDLPGTYSLIANSAEEEVARDFICFGEPDVTVVVADATSLERNLNLVLQAMEVTDRVVLCVNLMDEARKKRIRIDLNRLEEILGIPVVGISARSGQGTELLLKKISELAEKKIHTTPIKIPYGTLMEEALSAVLPAAEKSLPPQISMRWAAVKLLDEDENLSGPLKTHFGFVLEEHQELVEKLAKARQFLRQAGCFPDQCKDMIVSRLVETSERISGETVRFEKKDYTARDRKLDRILTAKPTGIPIMLLMLFGVLWLTLSGANVPSDLLAKFLFGLEEHLAAFFAWLPVPAWVGGLFVDGLFRTLAWVVSVMLPPMAIFFPLFTLLEDSGYLPRIAFNLDNFFRKACAHGKQALTMCMGFGCNAAGVIGCRIIDSPRERLIAIITNNFVPCNGRFPTLIAIIMMFFAGVSAGVFQTVVSTAMLTGTIVLGVCMTVLISKLLSKTILKGLPSSFNLELPPFRRPQIGKVIVRSVLDRTLFVLGRQRPWRRRRVRSSGHWQTFRRGV